MNKLTNALVLSSFLSGSFAVSGSALGSYWQTSCSNGDGSLVMDRGSKVNAVVAKKRSGESVTLPLKGDIGVSVRVLQRDTLADSAASSCAPDAVLSTMTWHRVEYQKVEVVRNDRGEFSSNFLGLSSDNRAIEAYWICETTGERHLPCS